MDAIKYVLTENQMPKAWYNIQADLPQALPPVLNPATGKPITHTGTMPKLPECDCCLLYSHNPHLVCTVHPNGSVTDSCLEFREDPNAELVELWEPEGATYCKPKSFLEVLSSGHFSEIQCYHKTTY